MVPFIDVMLVLLIIFMVTAPLIAPSMIDLPSVGKAARQPDQVIQVVIGKDEALDLKIGDKKVSLPLDALASTVNAGAGRQGAGHQRGGDQRRQERQVRKRGEGDGHAAARRRAARRPVGAGRQVAPWTPTASSSRRRRSPGWCAHSCWR